MRRKFENRASVTVHMEKELAERLNFRALSLGMSASELARQAIEHWISMGADKADAVPAGAAEAVSGSARVETHAPDTRRNVPLEDL